MRQRGWIHQLVWGMLVGGGLAGVVAVTNSPASAQEEQDYASGQPKHAEPAKQDVEALKKLDKKLDRILASLEALQKQLDAMKEELQIVKIRCTR